MSNLRTATHFSESLEEQASETRLLCCLQLQKLTMYPGKMRIP